MVVIATVVGVTNKRNTFTVHACIAKKDHKRESRSFTFVCKDEEQAKVWNDRIFLVLNPPSKSYYSILSVFLKNRPVIVQSFPRFCG